MTSTRVEVGGVHIAHDRQGTGPVARLVHGFTGDRTTMHGLATELAPCRTVVTVDLVGHGDSGAPEDVALYTMSAAVEQLDAVLDDLAADTIDLVGYSLGGRVALSFATNRVSRLRTLTLIGASPGLLGEEAAARRAADAELASELEEHGIEAFVDRWMALPMWRSLERRIGPAAWEASRRQRLRGSVTGLANSLRGMGTGAMPPLHDRLGSIAVPTLLVVGAEDTKFREIAQLMAARLPAATLAVIPDAGHAAHLEQPDLTAAAILGHLGCS